MPKLKISILYRIIEKYCSKFCQKQKVSSKKIVDFCFRCLDEHQKEASVLFSFIDIENLRSDYLSRLITVYSNIFDFNFISSSIVNGISQMQSEMILREKQNQVKYKEFVEDIKGEINKLRKINEKLFNEQKANDKRYEINLNKMKYEVNVLKKENEKQMNEINSLRDEIKEINMDLEQLISIIPFTDDLFKGIIFHLGHGKPQSVITDKTVEITASLYYNDTIPAYDVEYDSENYFCSRNNKDSWIMFDFKQKKVKLSHYSIKSSNEEDAGHSHLQNWCIEGSNDKSNWIELDTRNNEKSLDHRSASNTFEIQNIEENNYYEFIRLRQIDVNTKGNYELSLSSIEFFGKIFNKY